MFCFLMRKQVPIPPVNIGRLLSKPLIKCLSLNDSLLYDRIKEGREEEVGTAIPLG